MALAASAEISNRRAASRTATFYRTTRGPRGGSTARPTLVASRAGARERAHRGRRTRAYGSSGAPPEDGAGRAPPPVPGEAERPDDKFGTPARALKASGRGLDQSSTW